MARLISKIEDIIITSPNQLALVTTYTGKEERTNSFYESLNGKEIIISSEEKTGDRIEGKVYKIENVSLNASILNNLIFSILVTPSEDFMTEKGMFVYQTTNMG